MRYFYHIELLRFLSATAVLITHYKHFFFPYLSLSKLDIHPYGPDLNGLILPFYSFLEFFYRKGHYGVDFFWMISGFVLSFTYLNNKNIRTSFKIFFMNRFARLYPLHFITLFIVLILQILILKVSGSYQIIDNYMYKGQIDLENFFLHFFFISGWFLERGQTFNFPIWSVSIELVIYFVFFLSLKYIYKYKIFLTSILVFIFVFLDKSNINIFFLECGRFFFIGVLTYFIFEIIKKNFWLVTLSLFLIILGVVGNLKLDLFFSGIILLAAFCDTVIKIKNKKIYSLLGNLTYSSYLLHIPVQLVLMILILKFNFDFKIFNKNYFFIFYLMSIYFLSYFSFKYFENPARKYIRNKYSKI